MSEVDRSTDPATRRLARSRAELSALFDPIVERRALKVVAGEAPVHGPFPRSLTMKLLTRGRGAGGFAVLALALFATSPAKAMRLLKLIPFSAITKILVARLIQSRGAHR